MSEMLNIHLYVAKIFGHRDCHQPALGFRVYDVFRAFDRVRVIDALHLEPGLSAQHQVDVAQIITDAHGMVLLHIGELGEIHNNVSQIVIVVAHNLLLSSDLHILGVCEPHQHTKGAKDKS